MRIAGDGRGMGELRGLIDELGIADICPCAWGRKTGLAKAWL